MISTVDHPYVVQHFKSLPGSTTSSIWPVFLNPGQLITITPGGSAWGGINWYNTAQARQVDRHNQAVSLVGFLMCKSATCKFHNGCILLNM